MIFMRINMFRIDGNSSHLKPIVLKTSRDLKAFNQRGNIFTEIAGKCELYFDYSLY